MTFNFDEAAFLQRLKFKNFQPTYADEWDEQYDWLDYGFGSDLDDERSLMRQDLAEEFDVLADRDRRATRKRESGL